MSHKIGYLKNDNRESGGTLEESEILTCAHCQRIIYRKAWTAKGGWCAKCGTYVCFSCAKKTQIEGCLPWRKRVDTHLEQQALRRQLSKAIGLEG